jgi:polyhydroxybutyrate depolymerase
LHNKLWKNKSLCASPLSKESTRYPRSPRCAVWLLGLVCAHLALSHEPCAAAALTQHLMSGGHRRSYDLYLPAQMPTPVPVILALHGAGGSPARFARITRLHEQATPAGFLVAYPAGIGKTWHAGTCCGPAQNQAIDDVAFLQALLTDLRGRYPVDDQRIFVTGFSNGAKLAYRVACDLSEQIAAIAPVAATPNVEDPPCTPTAPVALLHLHGLRDRGAPFAGGAPVGSGHLQSVPATLHTWASIHGCPGPPTETRLSPQVTVTQYPDCPRGTIIRLITIANLRHRWPRGRTIPGLQTLPGPTRAALSATDTILAFFGDVAGRAN